MMNMSTAGGLAACQLMFSYGGAFRQAAFIHDAQLPIDLCPTANRCSPFSRGFKCCQIKGFQKGCIAWEYASLTVQCIQRFFLICSLIDRF